MLKTINETNPNLSRLFPHCRYAYFLILSMVPLILQTHDSGTDVQKGVIIISCKSENKMEIEKGAMNLDLNPIYNVASFH